MRNENGRSGTPRRNGRAAAGGAPIVMSSTEAQNGFGRMLDTVARDGTVLITKHDVPQAVVISADRYEALTRTEAPSLDLLTAEFDAMLERMQLPEVQAGTQAGLSASPAELGRAALAAEQRRNG